MSLHQIKVENEGEELQIQDLRAKVGVFVTKGQILFGIKDKNKGNLGKIKAPESGKPTKVHFKNGAKVTKGDLVVEFEACECDHPTIMKNMCAECGADLEQDMSIIPSSKSNQVTAKFVPIVHSIPELKVSSNEAQNLGKEDEKRLLKHRKLVLLVDLDQTVIHTTNENIAPNMRDVLHFQLNNHPAAPWYHTRIRPGTADFLKKISALYELHIVTFGARLYAHTIAKFLDPDAKFFSHRILSRDECFDSRSKTANLSSLFPCGDHMVCIIDDREDVWNFAPNLVHVKPYIFFKNTGDINAPPGSAKEAKVDKGAKVDKEETATENDEISDDLELSDDEDEEKKTEKPDKKEVEVEDTDDYLPYLEDILKNIHKAYYTMYDQGGEIDLKTVIPYVKRKVLQGTQLVFSGVVPTHVNLEKSKAFLVAKSLGAKVTEKLTKETTHLVAARVGTAKVNQARKMSGVHLVTPDWLWSCAERWEKVDEAVFRLCKSAPVTLKPPAHCSSPEIAFAERCPPISIEEDEKLLLAIKDDDLADMDKEVEEMLSASSDSEIEEESKNIQDSSSEDSLTGEMPKGQKRKAEENYNSSDESEAEDKFRRGEDVPSDYEIASQSDDDDELGAQLEREFLKDSSRSSFTNE